LEACAHPFFDDLRDANACLPNGRALPPLFNFTAQGKKILHFCFPYFSIDSLCISHAKCQMLLQSWLGHLLNCVNVSFQSMQEKKIDDG
jgi:hypothetical protein